MKITMPTALFIADVLKRLYFEEFSNEELDLIISILPSSIEYLKPELSLSFDKRAEQTEDEVLKTIEKGIEKGLLVGIARCQASNMKNK